MRLTCIGTTVSKVIRRNGVTANTRVFINVLGTALSSLCMGDGRAMGDVADLIRAAGLSLNTGVTQAISACVRHCEEGLGSEDVDHWWEGDEDLDDGDGAGCFDEMISKGVWSKELPR